MLLISPGFQRHGTNFTCWNVRGVEVQLSRNWKVSYDWLIASERKWSLISADVRGEELVASLRTSAWEANISITPSEITPSEICRFFIAELQRSKHASEAPWVRKIGNPSSQENLVMTSAYDRASERASERTSVQTRGEGEGRLEIFLTATHMGNSFLGGFLFRKVRKTFISVCHVKKRSEWLI